ncbi:hypothetical protein ACQEVB_26650 [Pseudonocardia sp. CA-107938]|uniref:hypothetical protein n=1 Tax=Pseudonocardia sp. CA-107938 TaxID=3240021 RepID=UPI003D8D0266
MDVEVRPQRPIVPMGPLDLSQTIGGAFRLFTITPSVTVGLPATAAVVGSAELVALMFLSDGLGWPGPFWPWGLVVLLAAGLVWSALMSVSAATSFVVLDHAVRGQRLSGRAALAAGLRRALGLLGVYLAVLLVVVLIVAIGTSPFLLLVAFGPNGGAGAFFGFALALVSMAVYGYAVRVLVSLITAGPAYVVERLGIGAALAAAREHSDGNWWRTYATLLVSYLLAQAAAFAFFLVVGLGILLLQKISIPAASVVTGSLIVVMATAQAALLTAVTGLLYYDQRARNRLRI